MITMQYAEVDEHLIALGITNFGAPYKQLFDQTDAAGAESFDAYSHNRFDNPFQKADEQRYIDRQRTWYGEIFRDVVKPRGVEEGETSPGEGFVPVIYVVAAKTPREFTCGNAWMPRNGLYVPVKDENSPGGYRFFKSVLADGKKHGTLIPEKVVPFDKRAAAERAFAEFGLPLKQLSGFYRLDSYDSERFVGRRFGPYVGGDGRFDVDAAGLPSDSGVGWVGSRPAYGKADIVMKVTSAEPAKV